MSRCWQREEKMPTKYSFISRALSPYESVLDLQHRHGDGVFCHVMTLKSRSVMTGDVIKNAFKWLVHYQPALRMTVHTEVGSHGLLKRFVERKDRNDIHVGTVSLESDDWLSLVENELMEPLPAGYDFLWRITFVEYPTKTLLDVRTGDTIYTYGLVFRSSHVLADHVSIHTLLTAQLPKLLQRTRDTSGLDHFRTPLFMKPGVDQSVMPVHTPRGKTKGKTQRSKMKASSSELGLSQDFPLMTEGVEDVKEARIRVSLSTLTKVDVSYTRKLCFKYDVSPQDVMTVAAVHAFHLTSELQRVEVRGSGIRVCHWLDLRTSPHVSRDRDPLGMWLCPVFTKHKFPKREPKQAKFWSQVKKFARTVKADNQPWKSTFRMYQSLLNDINKLKNSESPAPDKLQPPKAHISVSLLNTAPTSQAPHARTPVSKTLSTDTMSTTVRGSSLSSRHVRASVRTERSSTVSVQETAPLGSLAVDDYRMACSVSLVSVSPLHLAVTLQETDATCLLTSDVSVIPRSFAETFLDVFCKIIANMVRSPEKRRDSVVDRLPPYLRARLMSSPGVSKI